MELELMFEDRAVAFQGQIREAYDMPKRYPTLDLDPLPVDLINRTLGAELDPGRIRDLGLEPSEGGTEP